MSRKHQGFKQIKEKKNEPLTTMPAPKAGQAVSAASLDCVNCDLTNSVVIKNYLI